MNIFLSIISIFLSTILMGGLLVVLLMICTCGRIASIIPYTTRDNKRMMALICSILVASIVIPTIIFSSVLRLETLDIEFTDGISLSDKTSSEYFRIIDSEGTVHKIYKSRTTLKYSDTGVMHMETHRLLYDSKYKNIAWIVIMHEPSYIIYIPRNGDN